MKNKGTKFIMDDDSFNLKGFVDEVKASSQNSRTAIISLVLVSFFVFMTLLNTSSELFNWTKTRRSYDMKINDFLSFPDDTTLQKPLNSRDLKTKAGSSIPSLVTIYAIVSYVEGQHENEYRKWKVNELYESLNINNGDSTFMSVNGISILGKKIKEIVEYNDPERRRHEYENLSGAIKYLHEREINSRGEILNHIREINKQKTDNNDTVKVPILGIAFDINYLGLYSGLILLLMIWLLYATMNREHVNTKIAFKKAWSEKHFPHFLFYEYMSMSQVLHSPKKLFETYRPTRIYTGQKRRIFIAMYKFINNKLTRIIFYSLISFAILFSLISYYLDSYNYMKYEFNSTLFIFISIVVIFLVFYIILWTPFAKSRTYTNDNLDAERNLWTRFANRLEQRFESDKTFQKIFNNKLDLSYMEIMRFAAISSPLFVYGLVFSYDLVSAINGLSKNATLTFFTTSFEGLCCSFLLFYTLKVMAIKVSITDLWTNRGINFTFKYILGAVYKMDGVFSTKKNENRMLAFERFNKEFDQIDLEGIYSAERLMCLVKSEEQKEFICNIYNIISKDIPKHWSSSKLNVDSKANVTNTDIGCFEMIKYILVARKMQYKYLQFGLEYKNMVAYADETNPIERKENSKERIQEVKNLCVLCVIKILAKKRSISVDTPNGTKEWAYRDRKMASSEFYSYLNKILALVKLQDEEQNGNSLSELMQRLALKLGLQPYKVNYEDFVEKCWEQILYAYDEANKNSIVNNSFYNLLFEEVLKAINKLDVTWGFKAIETSSIS